MTTRPKRSGEQDRKDYYFISQEQFREEKKAKKLLEWTRYLGYYYATPKDFLERQLEKLKSVILCLNLKGTLEIKQLYPQNSVTIFVMPPSHAALLERMRKRCSKTKAQEVKQRLRLAQKELLAAKRYDYSLVNHDIQQATRQLKEIILKEIK